MDFHFTQSEKSKSFTTPTGSRWFYIVNAWSKDFRTSFTFPGHFCQRSAQTWNHLVTKEMLLWLDKGLSWAKPVDYIFTHSSCTRHIKYGPAYRTSWYPTCQSTTNTLNFPSAHFLFLLSKQLLHFLSFLQTPSTYNLIFTLSYWLFPNSLKN